MQARDTAWVTRYLWRLMLLHGGRLALLHQHFVCITLLKCNRRTAGRTRNRRGRPQDQERNLAYTTRKLHNMEREKVSNRNLLLQASIFRFYLRRFSGGVDREFVEGFDTPVGPFPGGCTAQESRKCCLPAEWHRGPVHWCAGRFVGMWETTPDTCAIRSSWRVCKLLATFGRKQCGFGTKPSGSMYRTGRWSIGEWGQSPCWIMLDLCLLQG